MTDADDTALLLVDLIHPFDFPGAEVLADRAARIVEPVGALVHRARAAEIPVLYVNDHFGQWRASFDALVERARRGPGAALIEAIEPAEEDIFVLKPHRSGFYCTPLELLLADLERDRLVLCGLTTDMCLLATVNDARMRDYRTVVPSDGCEAQTPRRQDTALAAMQLSFETEVVCCADLFAAEPIRTR